VAHPPTVVGGCNSSRYGGGSSRIPYAIEAMLAVGVAGCSGQASVAPQVVPKVPTAGPFGWLDGHILGATIKS